MRVRFVLFFFLAKRKEQKSSTLTPRPPSFPFSFSTCFPPPLLRHLSLFSQRKSDERVGEREGSRKASLLRKREGESRGERGQESTCAILISPRFSQKRESKARKRKNKLGQNEQSFLEDEKCGSNSETCPILYRTVTAAMLPWRGSPEAPLALIEAEAAAAADIEEVSSSLLPKTRQKRSVSSAAAVATVRPSGLAAMCSTRAPCDPAPLVAAALAAEEAPDDTPATPTVATRVRLGYFQTARPLEGAPGADE